tara:strand:+ start:4495 stop:5193 length:699 start_codon:yes stop_codon:yes gene_type:complete
MNRRDSIRSLFLGSIAGGLALESCITEPDIEINKKIWEYQYGRTPEEQAYDENLLGQQFFEKSEIIKIKRLANLILPPNENGNIEEAKVPEFIEFMAKDFPSIQTKMRGGLMWLDTQTNKKFGKNFISCSVDEQHQILDKIAYPNPNSNEQNQEVQFFTLTRNLVMTGYFTSEAGIKELGYMGNQPNVWDGVPEDVLKDHGMSYDKSWIPKFVDQSKRHDLAQWDEEGNLIS